MKHPRSGKVTMVFGCPSHIVIITEYEVEGPQEHHARIQLFQVGHARASLHIRRICPRDLKIENVWPLELWAASRIKVTRLGLEQQVPREQELRGQGLKKRPQEAEVQVVRREFKLEAREEQVNALKQSLQEMRARKRRREEEQDMEAFPLSTQDD